MEEGKKTNWSTATPEEKAEAIKKLHSGFTADDIKKATEGLQKAINLQYDPSDPDCQYINVSEKFGTQLTVSELIELLKLCPQDALVSHEGCDCTGEADRVELNKKENKVYIGRCN